MENDILIDSTCTTQDICCSVGMKLFFTNYFITVVLPLQDILEFIDLHGSASESTTGRCIL